MAFCLSFQLHRLEIYVASLCTFYSRHESHWLSHAGTCSNLRWSFLGWKRRVIQWLEHYSRPWEILFVISSWYFYPFFSVSHIVSQVPMCKTKVTALHTTPWRLARDIPSAKGKTANESRPYKNYCWYLNHPDNLQQFVLLQLSHTDA